MSEGKNALTTVRKRPSKLRTIERGKDLFCVLPAVAFLLIFTYYPLVDLFRISFTNWNLIKDKYDYVGMKNWKWLFRGSGWNEFTHSMSVTFLYTLGELGITLILGILLALLFNRVSRGFSAMRAIVFMPKYIAVSTSAVVFMWILSTDYGIANYVLGLFGVAPVPWLTSESTALSSVLILTAWRVVGYAMMIYISAIRGISPDYYEAASLDGANGFQKFIRITVPLLSPTTLFLFVTTFIASMKVFQSVDVMTDGGPYGATQVAVHWIYELAFKDFRVDRAAVVSCVFFVILLVCTALTMKWSNKSVNYDS
ncbi:MAG: sugar ABC transporter permease [Angelakisella sp.]